jgi:plasmid stabilization system protein ParE
MSLPFRDHRAVQPEIEEAYEWYEVRKPGLGREFLDELARVAGEIAANPARYGRAEEEIREAPRTRFPYVVYYRELSDHIRVLAVYHTSRDPAGWQSRS